MGSLYAYAPHLAGWRDHRLHVESCLALDAVAPHTLHLPTVSRAQPVLAGSSKLGGLDQLHGYSSVVAVLPGYCRANDREMWCQACQRVVPGANQILAHLPGVVVCAHDRVPEVAQSTH